MIQRIILDDFMAHKHTELLLGPGVTVLTGPNNSGKSAMVEALRCVATNPPPRHVIRHGATQARVEVLLDNGTSVTWARKKNTAWYELKQPGQDEPEYFRKLGRGMVPDEIRAALRLDLVDLESGTSVDVHVGDQKKPIFLLDMDGADARLAEFFAASSESAHLMAMQKALQSRNREAKTRERTLQEKLGELRNGLDRLAPLPEITRLGLLARESGKSVQKLERILPGLEQALRKGKELRQDLERAVVQTKAMRTLQAPPQPWDAPNLERRILELECLQRMRSGSRALSRALAPLSAPPTPAATEGLLQRVRSLMDLSGRVRSLGEKSTGLARLNPLPELFDEDPLSGLLSELGKIEERVAVAVRVAESRARQLEARREEIRERLERIGSCPLCGGRLDADSFTAETDAGDAVGSCRNGQEQAAACGKGETA